MSTEYKSWDVPPLNGEAPPHHEEDTTPHHRTTDSGTAQFASELSHGKPPKPLIRETFVAAEGITILYAHGGIGKGLISVAWIKDYLDDHAGDDEDVAVLDFEDHRWEWGSRLRGIGLTQEQIERRVHYMKPLNLLAKSVEDIRESHRDFSINLWIIDSYSYAAGSDDKMGGEAAAKEFFRAATTLPGVVLLIAHVSGTERHPAKPFGSVVIPNTAREMWSVAANEIEDQSQSGVINPSAQKQLELKNQKRSVGPMTLLPQVMTFTFWPGVEDDIIEVEYGTGKEPSVGDRILAALSTGKSYSGAEIKALLDMDGGKVVSRDTVNKNLRRLQDRSQIVAEGDPLKLRYRWVQASMDSEPEDAEGMDTPPPYSRGGGVHPSDVDGQMDMSLPVDGQGDGQEGA